MSAEKAYGFISRVYPTPNGERAVIALTKPKRQVVIASEGRLVGEGVQLVRKEGQWIPL